MTAGVKQVGRARSVVLPMAAVAVAVALLLSDWPGGWSLWFDHPYLAAFCAGLALLLLTGAVLDAYLRRREARRWYGIGMAASTEFLSIFYDEGIAIDALLGFDNGYRLGVEVEFHLAAARSRSAALLPLTDSDEELNKDALAARLSVLLADDAWRNSCSETLRRLRGHHIDAVSRWAGTFATLHYNDEFERVARSITIMDLVVVLHVLLGRISLASAEGAPLDDGSVEEFTNNWWSLERAITNERDFWNAQRKVDQRVELPAEPYGAFADTRRRPAR
jgi:hypothetical protein